MRKRIASKDVKPRADRLEIPELAGRLKVCPNCGETKDGLEGFGPRWLRGKWDLQSHCRVCRSASSRRPVIPSP